MITLRPDSFLYPLGADFKDSYPSADGRLVDALDGRSVVGWESDQLRSRFQEQGMGDNPFCRALNFQAGVAAGNGGVFKRKQIEPLMGHYSALSPREKRAVLIAAWSVAARGEPGTFEKELARERSSVRKTLGIRGGTVDILGVAPEADPVFILRRFVLGGDPATTLLEEIREARTHESSGSPDCSLWSAPLRFAAKEWGNYLIGKARKVFEEERQEIYLRAAEILALGGFYYLAGETMMSVAVHAKRLDDKRADGFFRQSGKYFKMGKYFLHATCAFLQGKAYHAAWENLTHSEIKIDLSISWSLAKLAMEGSAEEFSKEEFLAELQWRYASFLLVREALSAGRVRLKRLALVQLLDSAANANRAKAHFIERRALAEASHILKPLQRGSLED